jgi:hypothetical protein
MPKKVLNLRGEQGCDIYADTSDHAGSWAAFMVLEDATLSTLTMNHCDTESVACGIEYPQGFIFYGPITNIKLMSGTIQLFKFIED